MTKFEFLGDLSRLIADLPQEEVDQAMEYYEDYFADAGPEKEQEIIRDFISPAYIAEQLREASLQRQKAAARSTVQEEEKQAAAARAAAAASKPPVYSRKLAAQAQKNASMATASGFVTQAPTVKAKTPAAQPAQAAPSPTPVSPAQATPTQAASSMITPAAPVQVATTASASPQINRLHRHHLLMQQVHLHRVLHRLRQLHPLQLLRWDSPSLQHLFHRHRCHHHLFHRHHSHRRRHRQQDLVHKPFLLHSNRL